jgi:exopolyphosphatase/guanosine-5'-triphosphate,3'-diphosphate pyrophosphatase
LTQSSDLFAIIDLGSNSFHMLVVQDVDGAVRVIAKVKRKVRLAAGLDKHNHLDVAAMERGWQCLALFAERLSHIPPANVKVVATATLRLATNAQDFCRRGQQILDLPINVISGEREAELIYHGMAVTSAGEGKRFIVDIGGASTELILGQGFSPIVLNSLNMGCVTWFEQHFSDQKLSQQNFDVAIDAATAVLAPVLPCYLAHQWQLSLGASGSVQAVQEVLSAQGFNEVITLDKLEQLMAQTIACSEQSSLKIIGLKKARKPVFASGLAILISLFRQLSLKSMVTSGGALREGLIAQLLKQRQLDDLRLDTATGLQQRFQVDQEQAQQVVDVVTNLATQVDHQWQIAKDDGVAMLQFSAMLHEIGLSVNYLEANCHGRYLISHSPMNGFSSGQKGLVSALIANYKNSLNAAFFSEQTWVSPQQASRLATLLRLAVIISGRYQGARVNDINLAVINSQLQITLSCAVAQSSPLLLAELNQEVIDNNLIEIVLAIK